MITTEAANGSTYYSTEARGVQYIARVDVLDRWEVFSQRKGLSAARMGGSVRHFASAADLARSVKAFRELPLLLQM